MLQSAGANMPNMLHRDNGLIGADGGWFRSKFLDDAFVSSMAVRTLDVLMVVVLTSRCGPPTGEASVADLSEHLQIIRREDALRAYAQKYRVVIPAPTAHDCSVLCRGR